MAIWQGEIQVLMKHCHIPSNKFKSIQINPEYLTHPEHKFLLVSRHRSIMDLEFKGNEIKIRNKIITELDKFVFDFVDLLDVHYVIVSGYVAILFGRSRGTEDVDVLIKPITHSKFMELYEKAVKRDFYFLNSTNPDTLYEMLNEGLAVRIAKEDTIIPNIELKFIKNEIDRFSLENRLKVVLDDSQVYISPIEVQIAYKLYLGSDKDVEDAVYLWEIFKEHIDKIRLNHFMKKMNVDGGTYGIG
jgi:hypothetical protein